MTPTQPIRFAAFLMTVPTVTRKPSFCLNTRARTPFSRSLLLCRSARTFATAARFITLAVERKAPFIALLRCFSSSWA